jgi:hypothetical protein
MAAKLWLLGAVFAAARLLDPQALVEPAVVLSAAERARLDNGELVSRVLPSRKGQVAVFAATRCDADPATLVAAVNDITELKKSRFVTAVRRFSRPPQLPDLDALTLDRHDLAVLGACEVGRCSFKLSAVEIDFLKQTRVGDVDGDRIVPALRQIMLDRVRSYLASGLAALPPIVNRSRAWQLHEVLTAAQAESPQLLREPPLSSWLRDDRSTARPIADFLYWSTEYFSTSKPVILITHIGIYRPTNDVAIVVGKQIFGSRYTNGGLTMMAITTGAAGDRYLVYLNRSTVDVLSGLLGGLKRATLESRLSKEVPEVVGRLRDRLERSHHAASTRSLRNH